MKKSICHYDGFEHQASSIKLSANNILFNADQEVYVIDLNVGTGNSRFVTGMNTILVPRAIALQCKLNYTLEHLGSISTSHPLYQASFVSTNTSQAVSSAHVVVVISKNVSAAQAESLLYDLTHNSTDARIGNNVSIASNNLYLLHLPSDVLASIPMSVSNDGLGGAPNYLDPLGVITSILKFAFEAAFFVLGFGFILSFMLIDLGMKVLGQMISTAATVVKNAVDTLVNALNAFVAWAISFIMSILNTVLGPLVNAIQKAVGDYCAGVCSASLAIDNDIQSRGQISSTSKMQLSNAIMGQLFWIMVGVVIAVWAILLIVKVITAPFSFLEGVLLGLVETMLITTALSAIMKAYNDAAPTPIQAFGNWIKSVVQGEGGSPSAMTLVGTVVDGCCGCLDIIFSGAILAIKDLPPEIIKGAKLGIVMGLLGIALSGYAAAANSKTLDIVAAMISGYGLFETVANRGVTASFKDPSASDIQALSAAVSGFGLGLSLFTLVEEEWFK